MWTNNITYMLKSENKTTGDRLSIIRVYVELNAELAGTGRFVDANDLHLVRQTAAEEVQL